MRVSLWRGDRARPYPVWGQHQSQHQHPRSRSVICTCSPPSVRTLGFAGTRLTSEGAAKTQAPRRTIQGWRGSDWPAQGGGFLLPRATANSSVWISRGHRSGRFNIKSRQGRHSVGSAGKIRRLPTPTRCPPSRTSLWRPVSIVQPLDCQRAPTRQAKRPHERGDAVSDLIAGSRSWGKVRRSGPRAAIPHFASDGRRLSSSRQTKSAPYHVILTAGLLAMSEITSSRFSAARQTTPVIPCGLSSPRMGLPP